MQVRNTKSSEPILSQYLHQKGRRDGVPVSGTLELTSRCNFNCKMCYVHNSDCNKNEPFELSAAQWLEIGRQAQKAGTLFLLLTGGEPLIRKDFADIYLGLQKLGFVISINTNASLLQGDVAELFRERPPQRLNITLYGASEDTYEDLCENRCYNRVLQNILNIRSVGVDCRLNCSLTPYNRHDMEGIHRFATENSLNMKTSVYMYPPTRKDSFKAGENDGRFTPAAAADCRFEFDMLTLGRDEVLRRAEAMRAEFERKSSIAPAEQGVKMKCRAGTTGFWIDWRGNMSACGLFNRDSFNVNELGFDEAWRQVKQSAAQIRLPAKCVSCKYENMCNACAAVCLSETGRFDAAPPYVCEMSKKISDLYLEQENK